MTPGARIAAAIEVLDAIEEDGGPADRTLGAWFRARRFIGAKDRTSIAEAVFGVLRRRLRIDWWLARYRTEANGRSRMLADLALAGAGADAVETLFDGGRYAPAPPTGTERDVVDRLSRRPLEPDEMPEAVRLECPAWAESGLRAALGDHFAAELAALRLPAPVDLRVNLLKGSRETALSLLAVAGIEATPTPHSPWGIRLAGRPALGALPIFRDGLVEVQDEGSQLLAGLVEPAPGMQAVDFCAGAGGKALALAAVMQNRGRIVACDVHDHRLARLGERSRRAGAHNIERRVLSGERDRWVKRHKGAFDRVLVDAPCSGTGTWRRSPDARWRRGLSDLAELTALQDRILDSACRLVRPGGRLVYGTCSLLREENEDRVAAFLAAHPEFAALGDAMRLGPASHGTDGFFGAVMERLPALV